MSTAFLGKGMRFPFQFNVVGQTGTSLNVGVSENFEHINESIWQILGTKPGERIRLPDFGSRLKELVFEPNNAIIKSLAKVYVIQAIERWEKRVIIKEVILDDLPDQHLINILLTYTIIADQVDGNMVYPFYLGQEL